MNGQNPNNQENQMNGMNTDPNVLGSAQPLGQVPNMPTPGIPPIPPVQPTQPNGAEQPTMAINEPTVNVQPTSEIPQGDSNSYTAIPNTPSNADVTPNNNVNDTVMSPTGESINLSGTTPVNNMNIPGTAPINGNTPVGMDPVNVNGFVEPNKTNNIGTMPPPQQKPAKEKKPMNKVLFIILIVALMAAVAGGVLLVLKKFNGTSNIKVTTKDITVSVGDVLSNNIEDYATITGTDSNNCVLSNTNVNVNIAGEYKYSIICGGNEYDGKVIVIDEAGPIINVKPVYKTVDSEITATDFVVSCLDGNNECQNIEFVDAQALESNMATAGVYNVGIKATDSSGNETKVEAPLYVLQTDLTAFLSCSGPESDLPDYNAKKSTLDVLALGNLGEGIVYLNASRREYKYVFQDEEKYKEVIGNKESQITFDNVTGLASYDDENKTLIISNNLDIGVLNTEASGTFPTAFNEMQNYYIEKGYTCQILMNQ